MKSICELTDIQSYTGLTLTDIETIKTVCYEKPAVQSIVLFGSRSKKTWKKGSDVDLCLKGEKLTQNDITSISYRLNEETLLPYKFDVLLWSAIQNDEIAQHIERCGMVL